MVIIEVGQANAGKVPFEFPPRFIGIFDRKPFLPWLVEVAYTAGGSDPQLIGEHRWACLDPGYLRGAYDSGMTDEVGMPPICRGAPCGYLAPRSIDARGRLLLHPIKATTRVAATDGNGDPGC
jgi:hypothetical protein